MANATLSRTQQGMALFISLAVLLMLTMLGLASVQSTALQEQMVRNSYDTNIAFLAAESGLLDAEALIEMKSTMMGFSAPDANENGLYLPVSFDAPSHWRLVDWDHVDGNYKTAVTNLASTAAQPKYIIEHVKTIVSDETQWGLENIGQGIGAITHEVFRITVYGTGGSNNAHVMIQSTYGKQF
ncbi:MAG: type IV pilus assembly protein PilX [Candidatus Azotimanducaceae bacterium]|jgi:type IV pilus assembly protein PilX